MPHFDSTVSIGNILTVAVLTLTAVAAWRAHKSYQQSKAAAEDAQAAAKRDLEWRIKSLEIWRGEHMIDADARDTLIRKQDKIVSYLRWQTDFMLGKKSPPPEDNGL